MEGLLLADIRSYFTALTAPRNPNAPSLTRHACDRSLPRHQQCSNGITWRPKSSVPATNQSKMHITPLRPSIVASSSSCLATVVWLLPQLPHTDCPEAVSPGNP